MKIDIVPFAEQVCQKHLGVHHVIVKRHGELAAKFDFQATDRRSDVHSATKSIVSLAAGMAMDEGLFSLDTCPIQVLEEQLPEEWDPSWERVTVRHLLTMSSGHAHKLMDGYSLIPGTVNRDDLEEKDWVKYIFSQPLQLEPGECFMYNNACPHLISRMISKITGQNLLDWMRPRLFEPLGINNPQWGTDPLGYTCGPGGLQLTTEEYSRIAQLCLRQGEWHGRQLISKKYMEEAGKKQIENFQTALKEESSDETAGYGYFFWRTYRDDGYYMSGWAGQLAIILPKYDSTITMKSYEFRTQKLLDAVWETMIPQL